MTSQTKVILLGTGNPNPDPARSGPSVVIVVNETPYIIDFGPGLVRRATALTPQYGGLIHCLDPKNLKLAFLTHLHSDHIAGYPDLILTPWVMGRESPLIVYGPKGTKKMTDYILAAYQDDIKYRLQGMEPINDQGWCVEVHEFEEGLIYKDDNIGVESFRVKHGSWPNAYGFRFTTPEKVIVISGDTSPCKNMKIFGQGADILLHEVYYHKPFDQKELAWKAYHAEHHTSTLELAKLAQIIRPKLLVLYHTLFWGGVEQDILDEISSIYDGEVVVGSDLQVFE